MRDNREVLARQCVGNAFVISNPLVRGVLTAILWLQPLPSDYIVVGTLKEAEAWCMKKLTEAGISCRDR